MVKEGYKQTEVGVIPVDWEIAQIKAVIASYYTGGNYKNSDFISPYPLIKMGNIQRGRISVSKIEYINDTTPNEKDRLKYGDVLLNTRNTPELVGKVGIWKNELPVAYFNSNLLKFIFNEDRANPFFINLILNSPEIISEMRNIAKGTTSVAAIYPQDLLKVLIKLPPIREQERIAEALSDIDELISSLEKLIAKKKAIKQGTMQQLLTGKARLPGYTDIWNQNTFGELFDILPNNAYTRDQLSVGGSIKNIHYGDILTKYGAVLDGQSKTIPTLASDLEKKKRPESQFVHSGDIIIADTAEDETVGKAVELYNVNCKILSGQHTFFCHPKIEFAPMFLGYYLNSTEFHAQMLPYITGTKVSSISKQSLNLLIVRYPRKEEQEAIAKILYEMDCEIEALGKKLEKVIKNKQGMMQQLLTGKIRLM